MIIKDSLDTWNACFGIVTFMVLLFFLSYRLYLYQKNESLDLKETISYIGSVIVCSVGISLLLWCIEDSCINFIVSKSGTKVHEIVYKEGRYKMLETFYFDRSRIPDCVMHEIQSNPNGVYYYNRTDKDIVCFEMTYYSQNYLFHKKLSEIAHYYAPTESELGDICDSEEDGNENRNNISNVVIIRPATCFAMNKPVDYSFKPYTETIYRKISQKNVPDSVSIIIMDVLDSVPIHYCVIIKDSI